MKIKIVDKKEKNNDFVKISLSEKITNNRLVIKNGQNILEIKIPKKKDATRRKLIILVRGIIQENLFL